MVDAVNEYMLNLNCIILKTDCIYVDVSKDKLYFGENEGGVLWH